MRFKRPRFDTLFLRLFVLMWVTLIASHLLAFAVSIPLTTGGESPVSRLGWRNLPEFPSLPPGNPLNPDLRPAQPMPPHAGPGPDGPGPHGPAGAPGLGPGPGVRPGLPAQTLWLDYALRALLIGLGAWLGARWLAAPMQRLSGAAAELSQGLGQGRAPPRLDEQRGTVEVRETARVFNRMTQKLQHQFEQRSLHMAAISHDLRTPLTRLRLRIERLPDAAAQAASADIREMNELIDASLAVMREQSGGEAGVLDLAAMLQSLVDDLAEQGQPVDLAGELPAARVRAHPASLRRIVGNLVGNALRYGQRAHLGLEVVAEGVALHVDDEGPGIPPELLEHVFQPWVRLPGERQPGGSGLGLAIARDLAQREGGTLTLSNRSEGGLRATLVLPLA